MQLEGTTGILTGAAGGIGSALAHRLVTRGMRLVLTGRRRESLEALRDQLPSSSVAGICVGDLNEPAAQQSIARIGVDQNVCLLVNVCGCNSFGLLQEQRGEDVERIVQTNLIAPIQLTRLLLPHLQQQREAMIVNVGSTLGNIGFPGYAVYSASKFGLRGFSEALSRELADGPVRVVHVSPRSTATAMNSSVVSAMNAALGNAEDQPDRVAVAIVKAMDRRVKRAAIGWPERFYARLNQIFPSLVDRALTRQLPAIKRFAVRPASET